MVERPGEGSLIQTRVGLALNNTTKYRMVERIAFSKYHPLSLVLS